MTNALALSLIVIILLALVLLVVPVPAKLSGKVAEDGNPQGVSSGLSA